MEHFGNNNNNRNLLKTFVLVFFFSNDLLVSSRKFDKKKKVHFHPKNKEKLTNRKYALQLIVSYRHWKSLSGSLVYLCTPLGCVLSSLMLNRLGHKNCMIIANVPYLVSQVMFYFAEDVTTMYACSIMMGLGVGFSGGPFSAYIGEVSEPKLRGALMSVTNVFYFGGSLLFTTVYAITKQWRLTVLINMSIPIITIAILFVVIDFSIRPPTKFAFSFKRHYPETRVYELMVLKTSTAVKIYLFTLI